MTDNTQELDVNKLEQIIADHNKEMRADMASEITGGTRSKSITDVITVKAILDWHNKQVKNAVVTAEDNLDQYWNKELDKQIEEAMAKFHLKKGVKYDVKASDSVIVITHTNKLK